MRRLEFIKKNILEWRDYTPPKINSTNQVLVKPITVSRCDLDLPILRGESLFRPSFPIGHEFIGEIKELSEDLENKFKLGQKVAVSFQISCGVCPHCETGLSKSCSSVPHASNYGMGSVAKEFGGALSDLILVPYAKQMLLPIKETTNLVSVASISDNLVEAWKLTGMHLKKNSNQSVLILGGRASSIGLFTVALSKHLNASEILYLDWDKQRLGIAEKLGAKVEEVNFNSEKAPKRNEKRFHIVADCSGITSAWEYALRSISPDGNFSSASIFWSNSVSIPYLELYNFGANIYLGRVNSVEWMPKILYEIEEKGFDPSPVITKVSNWEDAKEAFLEEHIKLVIDRS